MTETAEPLAAAHKPKKSVALSGIVAGNTALCTVGRTGNDLHYRGYDILDIAESCEFEEIAYLLVHGKLPTLAELAAYKTQAPVACAACRACPRDCSNACQHRRTRWTSCARRSRRSARCCPKATTTTRAGARDIADKLMASLGSMLLYWHHWTQQRQADRRRDRRRFDRRPLPASAARQAAVARHGCVRCIRR